MSKFPTSTLLAAVTFAGILLEFHYAVDPARGLDPASLRPAAELRFDSATLLPVRERPLPGEPENLAVPNPNAPGWSPYAAAHLTLETNNLFDQNGALDHFYAALTELANGSRTRPVRVVHYGDSPTTADLITGDARELLQDKFGDAGPGFVLIAKPWAWYGHHGVDVEGTGWKIDTAVGSMREAPYGLGGAIFTGEVGAESRIRLEARSSTSIEVEYMGQPSGGNVEVLADGVSVGSIDTTQDEKKNAAATLPLPPGTKQVTLRVTRASVQVFGVAFGTGNKGITYDSIGLNGASTTVMSRAFQPANWGDALEHRDPDLVIINYGTNESGYLKFINEQYEGELRRAISRVRTALPQASILVMSPMDRGERRGGDAGDSEAGGDSAARGGRDGLRLLQHLRRDGRRGHHGALVRRASAHGGGGLHPSHAAGRADCGTVAHRAAADRLREVPAAACAPCEAGPFRYPRHIQRVWPDK